MSVRSLVVAGAVAVLAYFAGSLLGGETTVERVRVPATPETAYVPSPVLGEEQIARMAGLVPERATSDIENQADTVWQTPPRVAHTCPAQMPDSVVIDGQVTIESRWYLDTLIAPQERGDTALYAITQFYPDSLGRVMRTDAMVRHPAPPGPLKSVAMDSLSLHVDYADQWPDTGGCGFGCKVQWGLGGAAAGTLAYIVFGPG